MNTQLPIFEEKNGYGIEHSHDGGFYPYKVSAEDSTIINHLKDEQGLDLRCATRDEAVKAIRGCRFPFVRTDKPTTSN